jgi:hypothetical protein
MPAAIFRAAEMLDLAIQVERQGIAFYSTSVDNDRFFGPQRGLYLSDRSGARAF